MTRRRKAPAVVDELTHRQPRVAKDTARTKPARYQFTWRNPVTNEAIQIGIIHQRDYLASGQDHLTIESLKPKAAALPITATGYRSHFLQAIDLINAGGPVTFLTSWIEREAKDKKWLAATTGKAQGDLFQWADASRSVTVRKKSPGSKGNEPRKAIASPLVVPDPDYVADRETSDGQLRKRLAQRDRGQKPKPPREP